MSDSNQSSAASIYVTDTSRQNQKQALSKQAQGYESMLIKLEGDVRQHIRVEQQLKLHIEQMQTQTDDIFKDAVSKKAEVDSLKVKIDHLFEALEHEKM